MTKNILLLASCLFLFQFSRSQGILSRVKNKVTDRGNQKVDNTTDKALDKVDDASKKQGSSTQGNSNTGTNNSTPGSGGPSAPPSIKSYQNYDFVPGDKILFEDNFVQEQDGEFPSQWELQAGQGVINKVNGESAFFLTEGNYAKVSPRMKQPSYLTDLFTVEFDYYIKDGSQYGTLVMLNTPEDKGGHIYFSQSGEVSTNYFAKDFSASYPESDQEAFNGKWHHAALIYKSGQIKCYVDQYRVLVVPSAGFVPTSVEFAGIGTQEAPIIFRNVRIASGGASNMIGKKFTDAKIVTHGINFDVDKSSIKPESMGTLNMIVQVLKENPEIKFEIDGHTDNSGTSAHNLELSQHRADAVKAQLISMGVDASRLSSKGFGDTKPIASNDSPDGKANNRRVEFVKQ